MTNTDYPPGKYQKPLYFGMVILGLSLALFFDEYLTGASLIALAVGFDPYGRDRKWHEKTPLQNGLILLHVLVAVALIAYVVLVIRG